MLKFISNEGSYFSSSTSLSSLFSLWVLCAGPSTILGPRSLPSDLVLHSRCLDRPSGDSASPLVPHSLSLSPSLSLVCMLTLLVSLARCLFLLSYLCCWCAYTYYFQAFMVERRSYQVFGDIKAFFFLWQSAEDELRTLEEWHFSLASPWSCILLLAYYHEDMSVL